MTDKLFLIRPSKEHRQSVLDYRQEHADAGESVLHGASLLDQIPQYEDWLAHLKKTENPDTVDPGWVPATTFLAVRRQDQRVVGIIDIRRSLNDFLRSYGGNIGYGVRPSERGKGYATEMLRQALAFCREIGLCEVLLACDSDNTASERTILGGGGVLLREFVHPDGATVRMFRIDLPRP